MDDTPILQSQQAMPQMPFNPNFTDFEDPPPSYPAAMAAAAPPVIPPSAPAPETPHFRSSNPMTEEQVRELLKHYVNKSCCLGNGPLEEMSIRDISKLPAFRYKLEVFTEKREGNWKTVPYDGPLINLVGAGQGTPPGIWEFVAVPDHRFQNGKKTIELPNSANISNCPRCQGSGQVQCSSCGGSGSSPCTWCSGMGSTVSSVPATAIPEMPHHHHHHHHHHHPVAMPAVPGTFRTPCTWCHGSGRSSCSGCHRRGIRTCSTCKGKFRIKTYYELKVSWKNSSEACLSIDSNLDSRYRRFLKHFPGVSVASESSTWAQPLNSFPDRGVQLASRTMLEDLVRRNQDSSQRIIEFRQSVWEIPATIVHFSWKMKEDLFLIGGQGNAVHFPNSYPQSCCCCAIL